MRSSGWMSKNNKPYRKVIENGIMVVKVFEQHYSDGTTYRRDIVMVTEKGVIKIIELINNQPPTLPSPVPVPPAPLVIDHACQNMQSWLDAGWTVESMKQQGYIK
jgi:hypothetical protein